MLPRAARLHQSTDFRRVTRSGVRAGRPTVVVHAAATSGDAVTTGVRVGLVVSKAVGGSVVRSRVKRRLRHLAAAELAATPAGTDLVLRALPAAATRSAQLPVDLASGWQHAVRSLERRRAAEPTR